MKTLAIVGTGISGLGAAWFLHSKYDLSIFEQNDYVGGHSHTVVAQEGGRDLPVDTGFMVFNHVTYPLLTRLFRELGVETKPTDMSFSVQHNPSGLEYNGGNLNLLFGQRRNLLSPRHWRMLLAIDRFNKEAVTALNDPQYAQYTLGEYIRQRGYGDDMLQRYLVPMSSAVWSTPPEKMLDFPAVTLLRFWQNHGFLGLDCRHQWHTVVGGSRSYVDKISAPFAARIQRHRKVVQVQRDRERVALTFEGGATQSFDKVLLACHGDQALALLADPTELETRLLREFSYQPNAVTLHTDPSFMPRTKRCWASWNYRIDETADGRILPTTHYWMNRLQDVSPHVNYFVSLNCADRVAPDHVLKQIKYEHPLFSLGAIRAQEELPQLNCCAPDQTTYYAGAWFKYGFHEDGLASGLAAARAITGEKLWA